MEYVGNDSPIYVRVERNNKAFVVICDNTEQSKQVVNSLQHSKNDTITITNNDDCLKGAETTDFTTWYYEDYVSDLSDDTFC